MNTTFTIHRDKTVDYDGTEIPEFNNTFVSPLRPGLINPTLDTSCYILYQNWFGRWQIREEIVEAICYTGLWSYKMSNGWYISADNLGDTLFIRDELQKAKEECLRRNKMRKVKIKYLR